MNEKDEGLFKGFSRETLKFLRRLKTNNNKTWFEAHRSDYENYVLGPLRDLVTDVGDSARIVGQTGKVVPPENPSALAGAILDIIGLPDQKRIELGNQARERICKHYSLDRVVKDYESLYADIGATTNG